MFQPFEFMNRDFEQTFEISCLIIENDQKQNFTNACERVWNEIHRLLLFIIISTIDYHEHEPNIYSNGCTILRANVFCIQYTISDPHHVGEVNSPSSSWLGTNITAIKHGWLCYVYHRVCTIVRWLCHSGQVQDLAVGFDQDADPAVVMACPAMWYSKMVGFSTHSSSESTKQTIPHHSISSQFSLSLYPRFIYRFCDIQFL
jgi:hypothetical protein